MNYASIFQCVVPAPVFGAVFKDKWGTPDVIGIYKPSLGDIIQFPLDIISAEIKVS